MSGTNYSYRLGLFHVYSNYREMNKFLSQYRSILIYGDNQALEILTALSAIILTPALSYAMLSTPAWFLCLGVVFGVANLIGIGLNVLHFRLHTMRLLWSWFFAIIVLESVAGTHNFYTLYHVWIELGISAYNVWRINREFAYRQCRERSRNG